MKIKLWQIKIQHALLWKWREPPSNIRKGVGPGILLETGYILVTASKHAIFICLSVKWRGQQGGMERRGWVWERENGETRREEIFTKVLTIFFLEQYLFIYKSSPPSINNNFSSFIYFFLSIHEWYPPYSIYLLRNVGKGKCRGNRDEDGKQI